MKEEVVDTTVSRAFKCSFSDIIRFICKNLYSAIGYAVVVYYVYGIAMIAMNIDFSHWVLSVVFSLHWVIPCPLGIVIVYDFYLSSQLARYGIYFCGVLAWAFWYTRNYIWIASLALQLMKVVTLYFSADNISREFNEYIKSNFTHVRKLFKVEPHIFAKYHPYAFEFTYHKFPYYNSIYNYFRCNRNASAAIDASDSRTSLNNLEVSGNITIEEISVYEDLVMDVWYDKSEVNIDESNDNSNNNSNSNISNISNNNSGSKYVELQSDDRTSKKIGLKPVVIYIHGGGWIAGDSRKQSNVHLLHLLAANGSIVFAINHRKNGWPAQPDDCYGSFLHVLKLATKYGGDPKRVTLLGASAGGHLAILIYLRWKKGRFIGRDGIPASQSICTPQSPESHRGLFDLESDNLSKDVDISLVLYYPALDPADEYDHTTRMPFRVPFFKYRSFLALYFEAAALLMRSEYWADANTPELLRSHPELALDWPSTLVIHGDLDSIIPYGCSLDFVKTIHNINNESLRSSSREHTKKAFKINDYIMKFGDNITYVTIPHVKHAFENCGTANYPTSFFNWNVFLSRNTLVDAVYEFTMHWMDNSSHASKDRDMKSNKV